MIRLLPCVLALLLGPIVGRDASAQDRSGLMGGLSVGAGHIATAGSTDDPTWGFIQANDRNSIGLGLNLYIGVTASSRWTLLFEIAYLDAGTSSRTDGDVRIGSNRVTFQSASDSQTAMVIAGATQYRMTGRTWLRAGLGVASLSRDITIDPADLVVTLDRSTSAPAGLAVLGVDLWRRGNWAADVQVHVVTFRLQGLQVTAPSVQLGFTWY